MDCKKELVSLIGMACFSSKESLMLMDKKFHSARAKVNIRGCQKIADCSSN